MAGQLTRSSARDRQLRDACEELDRRLDAGELRAVEGVLAAYPELAADSDSALQLIYDELVGRERRGEEPAYAEYFQRFPHWREELRKSFDIHDALVRRDSVPVGIASTIDSRGGAGAPKDVFGERRFDLLEEIGRGGMGVVYRARQPGLNRVVALKMILTGEHASAEELARLRREAETAARLRHPNIVQVYEVGEQDGRPFLAMEYVEGGTLADSLKGDLLPAREAAWIVENLARAVQHAHDHGVLHRDLKPSNILLQRNEDGAPRTEGADSTSSSSLSPLSSVTLKIADFGLAKQLSGGPAASMAGGQTQTGAVVGTPNYMSPEQTRGALGSKRPAVIGPGVDIWALGVILYELLTGRLPFPAETALETLRQVESAEPLAPSQLRPRLPRDLETICLKCLEKEPRRRYASAGALADDLQRFRSHRPITARPVSSIGRAWRWCQRKPAVAGLTAALALVVFASLAGLTTLLLRAVHLQQRAQTSYELARVGLEECITKVMEDPRLKSGPLEDLRRTVLQAETIFYQKFAELQGTEPDFRLERGLAFSRLGDVAVELGDQNQALDHYRQAHDLLAALVMDYPAVPQYQARMAANQRQLAQLFRNTDRFDEAEQTYQSALAVVQALANGHPDAFQHQLDLARTHAMLGGLQIARLSRAREATPATHEALARTCEETYTKALTLLKELVQKHPTNPDACHPLGSAYVSLGRLYFQMEQADKAVQHFKEAETVLREFTRDHAGHRDFVPAQKSLANCLNGLANIYRVTKGPAEAEQVYWTALTIQRGLVRQHPLVLDFGVSLGNTQSNFGNLVRHDGRPEDALDWFAEAITTLEPLVTRRPRDDESRGLLRNAHLGRAGALFQLERHVEALPHLDRALELDDGGFKITGRLARAQVLAHKQDHIEATAEATALLAELRPDTRPVVVRGILHGTACVYALSAAAVASDDPLAERYAVRAVDLLRQARDAGYDPIDGWKGSADLIALRSRADFQSLFTTRKP